MPTTLNKRITKAGFDRLEKVGILAVPVVVLITTVVLTLRYPAVSIWISDAVQAEFGGTTGPSIVDPIAEPSRVLHAAKKK
jgi:hypothetical protein